MNGDDFRASEARRAEDRDTAVAFEVAVENARGAGRKLDELGFTGSPTPAEAVAAYRAELAAKVRALPGARDGERRDERFVTRATVLRLIEAES